MIIWDIFLTWHVLDCHLGLDTEYKIKLVPKWH